MTQRPGRPSLADGKQTKSMPIRLSDEDREKILRFAQTQQQSVARTTGQLLEQALELCAEDNTEYKRLQEQAYVAVAAALRSGQLIRATLCQDCGGTSPDRALDGHHHNGYAGDAQLDVRWLCRSCHRKAHPMPGDGSGRIKWGIGVRLFPETIACIKAEACSRGVSASAFVAKLLEDFHAKLLLGELAENGDNAR